MGKDRLFWSWDRQQQSEIPNREIRFETILDTLDAYLPKNFTALDLGSGPGALSFRILKRFPRARMIAVDFDPVLLKIGKDGLGTFGRRATFVDADLRANDWIQKLPIKKFDAAVSSTAIHWLDRKGLQNMYRNLAKVLRPQVIFLDADILPDGKGSRATEIAEKIRFSEIWYS